MYALAQDGDLKVYRNPDSETPLSKSDIEQLGQIQMQVAGGASDGSDTLMVIPFSTESFIGYGFNRHVAHTLETSSSTVQLDYISIIYRAEMDGMFLTNKELFYVSMIDISSALTRDELQFIRGLDLMAKRLSSFTMSLSYASNDPHTTVRPSIEIIEQKVEMSELRHQKDDDKSKLFIAIDEYLSKNGQVYAKLNLTKSFEMSSDLRMTDVMLLGQNMYVNGEQSDSLVLEFPLSNETSFAFLTKNKKNDFVLKLTPKSSSDRFTVSFKNKSESYFIPISPLLNSSQGETRVHIQTIFEYLMEQQHN